MYAKSLLRKGNAYLNNKIYGCMSKMVLGHFAPGHFAPGHFAPDKLIANS